MKKKIALSLAVIFAAGVAAISVIVEVEGKYLHEVLGGDRSSARTAAWRTAPDFIANLVGNITATHALYCFASARSWASEVVIDYVPLSSQLAWVNSANGE